MNTYRGTLERHGAMLRARSEPREMRIAGNNEIVLSDILVGEVWLCSGQSNMEWPMESSLFGGEEIPRASHPQIRVFHVRHAAQPVPQDSLGGTWMACSPGSVGTFSAVGYHFGRNLHNELKVPIGLIQSTWSGTAIEPWTPIEGFGQVGSLEQYVDQVSETTRASELGIDAPAALYNGMIRPLTPVAMRGVVWYQGESNVGMPDPGLYTDMTRALIGGWRQNFGQSDLSFYFVQIALRFDHVGGGLTSLDGNDLSHFTIAGDDRRFLTAGAEIAGPTVEVSCADVARPVAVRFAWHETAVGNLGNREGLPAAPFRTDRW